jgi:ABC-type multidrug transport system ATPase subunit
MEPEQTTYVLTAENINLSVGGVPLIQNSTLKIKKGEVVLLLGDNGSGKSTLIQCLCGYQPKNVSFSAKVTFEGKDCLDRSTISDNVGLSRQEDDFGFYVSGRSYVSFATRPYAQTRAGNTQKQNLEKADFLFDEFAKFHQKENSVKKSSNFDRLKKRSTWRLSGGEKKVLSIVAALSRVDAPLYILDEPLNNLDTNSIRALLDLIAHKKPEETFLIVTHCHLFEKPADDCVYEIDQKELHLIQGYEHYSCLEKGQKLECHP